LGPARDETRALNPLQKWMNAIFMAILLTFAACQITLRLAGDCSVDWLTNLLSIRLSNLLAVGWRSVYRFLWLSVGDLLAIGLLISLAIPWVISLVIGAALGPIDLGGARGLRL
jgi:hypothetical protein